MSKTLRSMDEQLRQDRRDGAHKRNRIMSKMLSKTEQGRNLGPRNLRLAS